MQYMINKLTHQLPDKSTKFHDETDLLTLQD